MDFIDSTQGLPFWTYPSLAIAVTLVALALVNDAVGRLAERRHPPTGAFLEVGSVQLHYSGPRHSRWS
jgi:NO-binding membrane sensor protein with MHYT domain